MVLSASMTLPQNTTARCTCSFRATRLPRVTFRGEWAAGCAVVSQAGVPAASKNLIPGRLQGTRGSLCGGRSRLERAPARSLAQHAETLLHAAAAGRGLVVRAQEGGEQPPASDGRESMLEALEAEVKARKGAKAAQVETQRPARRQQVRRVRGVQWWLGVALAGSAVFSEDERPRLWLMQRTACRRGG